MTETGSEAELCDYLFHGFNEKNYSEAADEIGEFIDDDWSFLTKEQFRAAVRTMHKLCGGAKTIEAIAKDMIPMAVASDPVNKANEAQVEKERAERAIERAAKKAAKEKAA